MPNEIDAVLQEAIRGLLYQSETDAPFEVFHWPDGATSLDPKTVLKLSGHKPKDPVETLSVGEFFKPLTEEQSWFGATEKAAARKYRQLQEVIQQHLSHRQVFRVGKIKVDIFIVGKSAQGYWAGVKTKAVET